jgi:hypothetical protein
MGEEWLLGILSVTCVALNNFHSGRGVSSQGYSACGCLDERHERQVERSGGRQPHANHGPSNRSHRESCGRHSRTQKSCLVSGSFPVFISFDSNENSPVDRQSKNFMPELERVARALNQSNLAIYPVDARGLLIPSEFDSSRAHPFSHYSPAIDTGVGQDEQVTMSVPAERTGGRAFRNTNDIQGAICRTLSESRFTYLVGFYPDHGSWNGQFHELKLRVKKSDFVLRYRKGYFALPDPPYTAAEARYALQAAMWSPVDATSLGIQARIVTIDTAARKLDLRVNLDASQLRFGQLNGKHTGSIDAIYLQLGPGDAVEAADPLSYNLDLSEKGYQEILHRGYELRAPLLIRPTTMTLRILVRDGSSGALGSVTIPLARFLPPLATIN